MELTPLFCMWLEENESGVIHYHERYEKGYELSEESLMTFCGIDAPEDLSRIVYEQSVQNAIAYGGPFCDKCSAEAFDTGYDYGKYAIMENFVVMRLPSISFCGQLHILNGCFSSGNAPNLPIYLIAGSNANS